jgi:CspA family cold shock protein
MSEQTANTTASATQSWKEDERIQGRVKWFNNKAGYGFITVESGEHVGVDVFVHHTTLTVNEEQYKYLVQGEYVEFNCIRIEGGPHVWQAASVTGPHNGRLMCETRREVRVSRINHAKTLNGDASPAPATERPQRAARASRTYATAVAPSTEQSQPQTQPQQRPVRRTQRPEQIPVRTFGVVNNNGEEWMLVRRQRTDVPLQTGGRGGGRGGRGGGRGGRGGRGVPRLESVV